jgi:transcriptional regulator with XRE-family HTH domain
MREQPTPLAVQQVSMILSTVVMPPHYRSRSRTPASTGGTLKQARGVRGLSIVDAARAASISPAYLSKLESDVVRKPSPHVLHQLSEALGVPYEELMRLSGYRLPDQPDKHVVHTVSAALFADLSDEERDELVEYLAWYRARRRARASHL